MNDIKPKFDTFRWNTPKTHDELLCKILIFASFSLLLPSRLNWTRKNKCHSQLLIKNLQSDNEIPTSIHFNVDVFFFFCFFHFCMRVSQWMCVCVSERIYFYTKFYLLLYNDKPERMCQSIYSELAKSHSVLAFYVVVESSFLSHIGIGLDPSFFNSFTNAVLWLK
jgi:hypothetical protein